MIVDALEGMIEALGAAVAAEVGHPVVDGVIFGPLERDYGCIYPASTNEFETNVNEEEIEIRVRIFKALAQPHDPTTPLDTAQLRLRRRQIIEALQPYQLPANAGPLNFQYLRVAGFEFSAREQWVEARVTAMQHNPFILV